ncbi:hypothetical protein H8959_008039, partial [Pygathrix nigripes]
VRGARGGLRGIRTCQEPGRPRRIREPGVQLGRSPRRGEATRAGVRRGSALLGARGSCGALPDDPGSGPSAPGVGAERTRPGSLPGSWSLDCDFRKRAALQVRETFFAPRFVGTRFL